MKLFPLPALLLVTAGLLAGVLAVGPADAVETAPVPKAVAGGKLEYNRDVRPILADACFACHGPDSAARKAGLRLDDRKAAVEAGAIEPGKPADSELLVRVLLDPKDDGHMPPPASHKKLKPEQKEILKGCSAWGAVSLPHGSMIPPKRPTAPAVNGEPKASAAPRNPIDNFVFAKLAEAGLAPAPEANRRTLARRLALDLTGLPPEPADVEAFVADKSPDWYEKYVDKLLASPHWGEHRGRYWLDYARYADTHGIHFDNYREVWAYRDWVIDSLNKNMPFDQFTVEQLAGDLLPNPTLDQQIATGFNRCHITTNEGGAISEEYLVLYTRDRTETASQVFLGLTTGCAVCHDHKFDPVSQKEFYSLAAFFNNTTQAAMDGNIPNTPPVIPVPRAEDRAKWDAVAKKLADGRAALDARRAAARPDFDKWATDATAKSAGLEGLADGLTFHAQLDEGKGDSVKTVVNGKEQTLPLNGGYTWAAGRGPAKALQVKKDVKGVAEVADAGDFEADTPFAVSLWVRTGRRGMTGPAVARMDEGNGFRGWDVWLEGDKVGTHIVNAWNGSALKVLTRVGLQPRDWYHVTVTYDGSRKASGIRVYLNGKPEPVDIQSDTLKAGDTIRTTVPFRLGRRSNAQRADGLFLQDVRLYTRPLPPAAVEQLAKSPRAADILAKSAGKRTPAELTELFDWWLVARDEPYRTLEGKLAAVRQEEAALRSRGTVAYVSAEKPTMPEAFVLHRGEYDQRRDKVGPDTPKALPPFPADLPKNRLGLAKWLLRPDHPLTARVTVNRFWQEVFGNGLVRTSGDFGVMGELPTHPELLDWLAVEFRESGWDVKKFFKLLVTSATYRQSAAATKEKLAADPDNRLLSRGPRYRLDAETIRDYALAASGLLVRKLGGPSVKPYQPEGVWEAVAMPESNTRTYKPDAGDRLYRRSLYTFWKRAAPPAAMEVLNAPNRETCAVRRERTNTPLQALLTLNDVQFVEAARVLAERTLAAGATDAARIDSVARRLLARPFRPEEAAVVTASLSDLRVEYKAKPEEAKKLIAFGESKAHPKLDPAELAAWTMLCNELLNLDEVLNK